jgi:hypothetical protein
MIYVINNKPYVKVANYYKEVSIEKKGKEFIVKPIGEKETRITNPKLNEITSVSVEQYYQSKNSKSSVKDSLSIND